MGEDHGGRSGTPREPGPRCSPRSLRRSPAVLTVSRGTVPVRDSRHPTGPVLNLPAGSFSCFMAGVKAGVCGTA
ncbi:DUF397 domain-containing protein [Streptomyces sp. NBC_01383]|uniref:DUF397 domain-containing protein n=1 Tax=unclassified Streptomyces TaxID=2593676 RepID=UPI000F46B267